MQTTPSNQGAGTEWWRTAVIYQIYPRSFMDSNHDGIGDLTGITSRLDYLQWLGVDAIWISPIFPSPMADFGYDVSDYTNIDPMFGTLDDFDTLLGEAHRRGLKILLDFVPNHTSSQHRWFKESRSSKDSDKRNWYIWRNPGPDGGPPNNWMSYFGGPAWTFDKASGQYYLHNFASEQPDLNWRNPDVEAAMHEQMRFWLDRGIDGFRVDVIDRLIKDTKYRDNPPDPDWSPGEDPTLQFKRVYSEKQPEVMDVMRRMRLLFDEYDGDRVIVGEAAYDLTIEQLISYYGATPVDGASADGIHLPFNFHLMNLPWDAAAIKAHVDELEATCPQYATPNYVLGNHDKPRIASTLGAQQARVAAVLLLTLRGVPTLYYGDEIGMENVSFPPDQVQDPMGRGTTVFNRDECRTPMQWDESVHGGFCPTEVQPWLPLPASSREANVKVARDDDRSLLGLYRELLLLRRESVALHSGDYEPLIVGDGVFGFFRRADSESYLVLLNFTDQPATAKVLDGFAGTIAISTSPGRRGNAVSGKSIELLPAEGSVIRLT